MIGFAGCMGVDGGERPEYRIYCGSATKAMYQTVGALWYIHGRYRMYVGNVRIKNTHRRLCIALSAISSSPFHGILHSSHPQNDRRRQTKPDHEADKVTPANANTEITDPIHQPVFRPPGSIHIIKRK